ncbi:MAG: amino acid adenylation domain-containing protein, partial [bacterium]|nr:amino acid adenylation domain-containing protein [bacterium]
FFGPGRVAILEKDGERYPGKLVNTIKSAFVTHINFVPSVFNAFIGALDPGNSRQLAGLKYIFLAGEAIAPQLITKYRELSSTAHIALENIYGPTENTIYTSKYSLIRWQGTKAIPIGKPLKNVQIFIVAKNNNLQPVRIAGELVTAGQGVARGYINQPERTAEKFVLTAFFSLSPGTSHSPIYKSGDLALWLPDGNIEFLGRMDHQVKVRGFRIELGEIESRLRDHPAVKEAVVIARDEKGSGKNICAYIVSAGAGEGDGSTSHTDPGSTEL